MNRINWKLRFKNKTVLTSIVLATIALVYQVLAMINVVPEISQNQIVELSGMVINLLVLLGIVVDPTTDGITDSDQAMEYNTPRKNSSENKT